MKSPDYKLAWMQVFVTGHRFDRSLRVLPYSCLLDEDGESQCMRHIIAPPREFDCLIACLSGNKAALTHGISVMLQRA